MKILMVDESSRGGVCQYTYNLSEALQRAGHEVTVASYERYELADLPRTFRLLPIFRSVRLPALAAKLAGREGRRLALAKGLGHFASLRRLMRLIKEERPDVVHIQWLSLIWLTDWALIDWLRRRRIPVYYTCHDLVPYVLPIAIPGLSVTLNKKLLARSYRRSTGVLVHGEAGQQQVIAECHVSPANIAIIPHAEFEFLTSFAHAEGARARLGIPPNARVALFFGRIGPQKGLDHLLDAWPSVREHVANAHLLIAGDAQFAPRAMQERLATLGSPDITTDLRYLPLDSIGQYFAAADVVVLPYERITTSGVLYAAYAFGRAVVASRLPFFEEWVDEGSGGLLTSPMDAADLARALIALVPDAARCDAYGRHNQARAQQASPETAARALVQFYRTRQPTEPAPRV